MSKRMAAVVPDFSEDTANTLIAIGERIRKLRQDRKLTLQMLGKETGLSASMLSLVERGKTSASIGTLIVISSALGVQMSDFLSDQAPRAQGKLNRRTQQKVHSTAQGVLRRILCEDQERGIEVAINEYQPDTGNSRTPLRHAGYEYGVLLEGKLNVEVDGINYLVQPGDLISYESNLPHRLWNCERKPAKTLWINLNRYTGS